MRARFLMAALLVAGLLSCRREDIILVDPDDEENPVVTPTDTLDDHVPYYLYGLADIAITTDGGVAVDSKDPADYRPCTIQIEGGEVFPSLTLRGAIRGRGNSTWNWYRKKPYRIKLDESSRVLGMKKNKDWVLLADYRDVTHLMNNVGFTLAHELGIRPANRSRYANVTLNGQFIGLYMVTEQVEEGKHRVELDQSDGILLALDINDGPGDEPYATNNFYSDVFGMAAAVKYPRDATTADRDRVRKEFAILEQAIDERDWNRIQELLDVESMIHYILVQEIIGNVEMDNNPSLRSGYIHRYGSDSLWVMGPVWDCDGGFSYNWGDMYDSSGYGHTFFSDYRYLVFGSDPYNHRGAYGTTASDFFCRLFGIPEFVEALQARWAEVQDPLLEKVLEQIAETEDIIGEAAQDDLDLWGISNYDHEAEVKKLIRWLTNRFGYLDGVIKSYPTGASSGGLGDNVSFGATLSYQAAFPQDGHHFGSKVYLDGTARETITAALGIPSGTLADAYAAGEVVFCAVEPDGTINPQNTANAPGHWFDANGNVTSYGSGSYVYSEYNLGEDSFTLGKHPSICTEGTYSLSQAFVCGNKGVRIDFQITVTGEK